MAAYPPITQLKGRALGRVLIKMGKITRDKVQKTLAFQKDSKNKTPIGQILMELGYINEADLNLALAFQTFD